MKREIVINRYPWFVFDMPFFGSSRRKEAFLEANLCRTMVEGEIVENRLISVSKTHIYLLRYAPVLFFSLLMGWGYELSNAIGIMLGAIGFAFYRLFFVRAAAKEKMYTGIGIAGLLIASLFSSLTSESVIFTAQYAVGFSLLFWVYVGVQSEEWKRYRRVEGLAGIYVFVPFAKKSFAAEAKSFAAVLFLFGLALTTYHGYHIYLAHQNSLAAALELQKEENKSSITVQPSIKRQESTEEKEALRRLGIGGEK